MKKKEVYMKSINIYTISCAIALITACSDSTSNTLDSVTDSIAPITESPDIIDEVTKIQCSDGSIVDDINLCPTTTESLNVLDTIKTLQCSDGSIVNDLSTCPDGSNATEVIMYTCADSSQVLDKTLCKTIYTCTNGTQTYDANSCPKDSAAAEVTMYTCGNGTQVLDKTLCKVIYTCPDGSQTYDANSCQKIESSSSEEISLNSSSDTKEAISSSSQITPPAIDPIDISEISGFPTITFANNNVTIANDNSCIAQSEKTITITCAGNYQLTGSSVDNQVIVAAQSTDKVYLYINNLQLASANDAPIYVQNAEKVFLILPDGTTNTLEDASSRTKTFNKPDGALDTTSATIYAKDDLTIKGSGSLKVTGNYNNGIHCSNDLRFKDAPNVTVTAKNHAVKGKGSVTVDGGIYTLTSTNGDGIQSDECTINGKDTTITDGKGIVVLNGGEFNINAGDDGIQAYNYVLLADSVSTPKVTIVSKDKGIVSTNRIYMNAGITNVTSTDDAIHSNMNIYINGGSTTISAGDDGIHADSTLRIAGGEVNVTKANEGFEAWYIVAVGGKTAVNASDDGWNAAGGSADGATASGSQWGGFGGGMGGGMSSSVGYITIEGGYHYLYAAGGDVDVLDANGTAKMSGGVLILELGSSSGMGGSGSRGGMGNWNSGSGTCQTNGTGGIIDTDNGFSITGGVLLGFGSQTEEYPNCTSTSYTNSNYYGSTNAAFKPSGSGSMIVYGGAVTAVSTVDVSAMNAVTLPNGMIFYEK